MQTVSLTGPGFYAAETNKTNPNIPPNKLRVYQVRVEVVDLECDEANPMASLDADTSFTILFSMGEKNRAVARALTQLRKALNANSDNLNRNPGA